MIPDIEVKINLNAGIPPEARAPMEWHARTILRAFVDDQLSGSLSISVLMNVLGSIICSQVTGGRHRPLTHDEIALATKILSGFDQAVLQYFAMFGTGRTAVTEVGKAKA